jgi:hypothetical protein
MARRNRNLCRAIVGVSSPHAAAQWGPSRGRHMAVCRRRKRQVRDSSGPGVGAQKDRLRGPRGAKVTARGRRSLDKGVVAKKDGKAFRTNRVEVAATTSWQRPRDGGRPRGGDDPQGSGLARPTGSDSANAGGRARGLNRFDRRCRAHPSPRQPAASRLGARSRRWNRNAQSSRRRMWDLRRVGPARTPGARAPGLLRRTGHGRGTRYGSP